jgi:hypothetical protein
VTPNQRLAAAALAAPYVDEAGRLVVDGRVVCPWCLEDLPRCEAAALTFTVHSELAELAAEAKTAPVLNRAAWRCVMSDTTEMVRLIRHAADRLAQENPPKVIDQLTYDTVRKAVSPAIISMAMAMTFAESMLRMVAACMEPESEPTTKALARVRALIGDGPYVRTDELLEALGED